jgi:hypothetical protein
MFISHAVAIITPGQREQSSCPANSYVGNSNDRSIHLGNWKGWAYKPSRSIDSILAERRDPLRLPLGPGQERCDRWDFFIPLWAIICLDSWTAQILQLPKFFRHANQTF